MEDSSSLPNQRIPSGGFSVVRQEGVWLPSRFLSGINATIEHFKPLPTDIIMISYPKSGTTWLKALLYSIVHRSSKHRLATVHPQQLIPFLEKDVYGKPGESPTPNVFCNADNGSSLRIFHTHIPYQLLAKALEPLQCRVVYVTRNPKDSLVSWWHFVNTKMTNGESWPIDLAVEDFCSGRVAYGPYYDHVMGYKNLSSVHPQNVFFLTYEELKNDSTSAIRRLGSFLGFPFEGEGGEEQIEEIVKGCSFEMLSNHQVNKSEETMGSNLFPSNAYFRKGKIGDHKNILNQDMIEKIDTLTKEKFHSANFTYGI